MSCDYNCENNCEECEYPDLVLNFVKGYNQALDDFRKLANEHLYDDNLGDFAITDSSIDKIIEHLKR